MHASAFVLLVAAGVLAGALGSAGGITSLVSYPALLVVGLPPRDANVVNLVAVVACWPGSALVSRRELAGSGRLLATALPVAAVGALAGSVLLLTTPTRTFDRLAPFLVLLGSAALLAQPWLTRRFASAGRSPGSTPSALLTGIGIVSIYSGYFGAGSGVLLLALLLALQGRRMPVANAQKNMLVGASGVASALLLLAAGAVDWAAVLPLAIGEFAGSLLGPVVNRVVPALIVRVAVAALGVVLAVELLVTAG